MQFSILISSMLKMYDSNEIKMKLIGGWASDMNIDETKLFNASYNGEVHCEIQSQ